jgi:hypothetical protein
MILRITILCFLASLVCCGCSKSGKPGQLKTTPVTGAVQVDGEPVRGVVVSFAPVSGSSDNKNGITVITLDDGRFSCYTYVKDDGLPAGTYTVTFAWPEESLKMGKKPDRLKGAYSNRALSDIKVTVEDGQPVDMGVIELSTKGKPKK